MNIETFWHNVDVREFNKCWEWKRAISDRGYGVVYFNKKNTYAHRVAYEDKISPILKDQVIDHLCRNRACCNPSHLEAVSQRTNILRGQGAAAIHAIKTKCRNGHIFNDENTYIRPDGSGRDCRICRKIANQNHYQKRKLNNV